ncbi:MAG: hypothetical protein JW969_11810 [Spirochaetales bacterium]|nr:hypothetical protein [Spirochaetales bacterium]
MVEGISSINSRPVFIPNMLKAQGPGNKLSVPVRPLVSMYARFKHIVGVPSDNIQSNVPVSKLRILDTLIEKLVANKGSSAVEAVKITDENIDSMIEQAKTELGKEFIRAATLYKTNISAEKGTFINTFA